MIGLFDDCPQEKTKPMQTRTEVPIVMRPCRKMNRLRAVGNQIRWILVNISYFFNHFLIHIFDFIKKNDQVPAAIATFTSIQSEKSTGLHIITQLFRWRRHWRFNAIGQFNIATQNDLQTNWNRYRLAVGNTIKIYRIIFSTECYSCNKNDAIT